MRVNVHKKVPSPQSETAPLLHGVVFDIDGVIFDSKEANTGYYNQILAELGLPPMSEKDVEYCHMATGKQALERIVPKYLQAHELKEAQQAIPYFEFVVSKLELEKGLVETLNWLKNREIQLGICTNRLTRVPELLEHFGIAHFFSSIKTASNAEPKPSPQGLLDTLTEWSLSPLQAVFIGDTIADQMAAHQANMVFWAFGNPDLEADEHFSAYAPLLDFLPSVVK